MAGECGGEMGEAPIRGTADRRGEQLFVAECARIVHVICARRAPKSAGNGGAAAFDVGF